MSDPHFTTFNFGDTADDDGPVIDSLVQAESEPPKPVVEPIPTTPLIQPAIPTRLLSVRQLIDPTWVNPTLIFPADIKRKFLRINVTSTAETSGDGIVIRSDNGDTWGLARVYHGQNIELPSYTGPVNIVAVGAAAVYVDVWSVTE